MSSLGRTLIIFGVIFVSIGVFFTLGGKIPWLGRLPGDIYIHKKDFTFFFPITTSIIISAILSLILIVVGRR